MVGPFACPELDRRLALLDLSDNIHDAVHLLTGATPEAVAHLLTARMRSTFA